MMTTTDPRVVAYLHRLEEAAARLRPERRAELVEEIREHIDTRLSDPGTTAPSGDAVDAVLARLGEPEEIVSAAAEEPGALDPAYVRAALEPRRGSGGLEAAALILLLVGGFLFFVGWIVGAVLLWMSPRWTVREKLLATLVWPGGLATPVLLGGLLAFRTAGPCTETSSSVGVTVDQCSGVSGTNVLAIVLMVLAVAAPLVVTGFLGFRASRRGAWK